MSCRGSPWPVHSAWTKAPGAAAPHCPQPAPHSQIQIYASVLLLLVIFMPTRQAIGVVRSCSESGNEVHCLHAPTIYVHRLRQPARCQLRTVSEAAGKPLRRSTVLSLCHDCWCADLPASVQLLREECSAHLPPTSASAFMGPDQLARRSFLATKRFVVRDIRAITSSPLPERGDGQWQRSWLKMLWVSAIIWGCRRKVAPPVPVHPMSLSPQLLKGLPLPSADLQLVVPRVPPLPLQHLLEVFEPLPHRIGLACWK